MITPTDEFLKSAGIMNSGKSRMFRGLPILEMILYGYLDVLDLLITFRLK